MLPMMSIFHFYSSDAANGRRGGGRSGGSSSKSGGSSRGGFHSLPKGSSSSGQSSSRHAKLAGMAAAGAAVGYGLSSLGRSHFSRGGQGSSGGKQMAQPGFQNPNWSDPMAEGELYSKAPKEASVAILLISSVVCGVTYIVFQC
uniref:Uncharacterized protein n=1 Tax=Sphaerodactylus townsendi TaxID=933632 RepID=A0ACB8F000_9SAUR